MGVELSIRRLAHGLHLDVTDDEYHAPDLCLASKHGLDDILRAPALFKVANDVGAVRKTSEAKDLGVAFHMAAIQPDLFLDTYTVMPDFGSPKANKKLGVTTEQGRVNKALREEWLAANEGRTILEADDAQTIACMVDSLRVHPVAGPLLERAVSEVVCRWRDPRTGIECKAKADLWVEEYALLADLKGLFDGSWSGFRLASERYKYHRQDSFYRRGWAANGFTPGAFFFVCVEKTPPFLVSLFEHEPEDVEQGATQNDEALTIMAQCLESGQWPGYPTGIQRVKQRRWAHERG